MWILIAADDTRENIRIAEFSSIDLAKDYLSKARVRLPNKIFSDNTLLVGCVWARITFEEKIPVDPVL